MIREKYIEEHYPGSSTGTSAAKCVSLMVEKTLPSPTGTQLRACVMHTTSWLMCWLTSARMSVWRNRCGALKS